MAASIRAPKQWCLTKAESVNSFENWRQNIQFVLSQDKEFSGFLAPNATWGKKAKNSPLRGFVDDDSGGRTAQQKLAALELMLGQIANYCPVISRSTLIKNTTCMNDIWQTIRLHYGFQSTGARFLDLADLRLEADERPEDLYQRISAFVEDSLLQEGSGITHHGKVVNDDEELTPTLENFVVLTWLRLIHADLPRLVKQRYGTELRSRTLASIKPEISLALSSLMDELHTAEDVSVMRSGFQSSYAVSKRKPKQTVTGEVRTNKLCPLCREAGRQTNHFLSQCKYLPERDKQFMARARHVDAEEENDGIACMENSVFDRDDHENYSRRVQVEQSPFIDMFYKHHPVQITLDSGATGNMMRYSTAKMLGANIVNTKQSASQADGSSPLTVLGETRITFSRDEHILKFDGLVVEQLDVEVLGGVPFMKVNDVQIRPSRNLVIIGGQSHYTYAKNASEKCGHTVRRTQASLLRVSECCTVWPGGYLELVVPEIYQNEKQLIVEPRMDSKPSCAVSSEEVWPEPDVIRTVGGKVRIVNLKDQPLVISKGKHIAQIHATREVDSSEIKESSNYPSNSNTHINNGKDNYNAIKMDNCMLELGDKEKFKLLHMKMYKVFEPSDKGYNGKSGQIEGVVNIGPVQPPQRKGRVPQYSRNRLVELQEKFDELESRGVFRRPEEVGIVVEYLNPSFLVKKSNGGFRLVTAFTDVGKYSKPQPSLMPDVNSVLRAIGQWKYLITTDLSNAFYQIHLSKSSMKYCGVVTPFRGVRVYTRCAMGMPGSETALEELMCRVLGDLLLQGVVTKIADDLYCGGNSPEELYDNWKRVLHCLSSNNISISASKTTIAPRSTTILGWKWSQGVIEATPHRVASLSTCSIPATVKELRSFIGAYKVLSRVIPQCVHYLGSLENMLAGRSSTEKLVWSDDLREVFSQAQLALSTRKAIVIPRPCDQLWIVTDGASKTGGLGGTMYANQNGKIKIAGFFSAKLRKHQNNWLPCEIEALSIAAAVKHFSPFLIQSKHKTSVVTDSKPCVQAYEKLCRGEYSASPRVSTFLATASRYQVAVNHVSGAANLVSDFGSRNAQPCTNLSCQICSFVNSLDDSVVRGIEVSGVLAGRYRLPFTSRTSWKQSQAECSDLRRVRAHLLQGTRPSKKQTNVNDVKRYLNTTTLAHDGLIVVRHNEALKPVRECIVVPKKLLYGLLTALHLQLSHPSCHQLKQVFKRYFYCIGYESAVKTVSDSCHQCASLRTIEHVVDPQSTMNSPGAVGHSFAADVLKRSRQFVLVLRETVTSYTTACIIADERASTLRDGLICLCSQMRQFRGPLAVIRTDPAPGFQALVEDALLNGHRIKIELGSVKNQNKNPVAEKALQELLLEHLRLYPTGGPFTERTLAETTAMLNSRIRNSGLSAMEHWTQRDQFTGEQLPLRDRDLIKNQSLARSSNHPYSEKSKCPKLKRLHSPCIEVGDLVYINSDGSKLKARDKYIVVDKNNEFYNVRKFAGDQLRSKTYKVKPSECYKPLSDARNIHNNVRRESSSSSEDTEFISPSAVVPTPEEIASPLAPANGSDKNTVNQITETGLCPGQLRRSERVRRTPEYLHNYELY